MPCRSSTANDLATKLGYDKPAKVVDDLFDAIVAVDVRAIIAAIQNALSFVSDKLDQKRSEQLIRMNSAPPVAPMTDDEHLEMCCQWCAEVNAVHGTEEPQKVESVTAIIGIVGLSIEVLKLIQNRRNRKK
jgi:hypothetical protein